MMSRPTIFAQVRRGAHPAHTPDGYRYAERSGMRLVEEDDEPLCVDLTGFLFSCYLAPTEQMLESDGATWRVFECPQIDDPKHIERVVRVDGNQRETESRPWEHRAPVRERDWQRLLAKHQAAKNPKPVVIKPNASEKFFQPCRVQIVTSRSQSWRSSDDRYGVIVFDQVARRVVEMWQMKDHRPSQGEWVTNFSHDPTGMHSAQEF